MGRVGRSAQRRRLIWAGVEPAGRKASQYLRRFVVVWLAVLALALGVTQRTAALTAANYRIDQLAARVTRLRAADQALGARCATLSSAGRLAQVAQVHGLVLPPTVVPLPVGTTFKPSETVAHRRAAKAGLVAQITRITWRLWHGR